MSKPHKRQAEFVKWMGPLLDCLRALGGSAKPREISDWIADTLNIPDEKREATLKSGGERFHNQVAWARQYLIWEGLLDGSRRGIWTLTDKGWKIHLTEEDGHNIFKKWVDIHAASRRAAAAEVEERPKITDEEMAVPPEEAEDEELLTVLRSLPPGGFERVCQRLLRESGFEKVIVTGKSHDEGIDGIGVLQINPFVSFKVLFQCKKYRGSVSRAAVGDFRNAMIGRADKGIMMTTGTFTAAATQEANREGAPPVELVDGQKLIAMFQAAKLGVKPRTVYEVDHAFFDQFREMNDEPNCQPMRRQRDATRVT
jgi:restriction system protein